MLKIRNSSNSQTWLTTMLSRFLFILTLILSSASGFAEDDFLPPEQAFAIQEPVVISTQADGNNIIISWKIADGYYIYKNKVAFLSADPEISLGDVRLSDSETKDDPFFGEIQVYKHELQAEIPYTANANANANAGKVYTLTAKSQGCAEAGICYPPLKQKVTFKLPLNIDKTSTASTVGAALTNTAATPSTDALTNLGNSNSAAADFNSEDEVLEIDDAFIFDLSTDKNNQLIAIWSIADGHYLYKDKFKFELIDGNGFTLGTPSMPPGKQKNDEYLGDFEAYYRDLSIKIPVTGPGDNSRPLAVKVSYQGCSEAGICYPKVHKNVELDVSEFSTQLAASSMDSAATDTSAAVSKPEVRSEQDALAKMLVADNSFVALLTFFVIGLGLAFTPCVFPMIPILSGIIAGQGSDVTSRKAFTMSVVYVLSMAVVYTAVGIIAGLSGKNIQVIFQNPWVIGTFALIFVLLALSMFGFYNLQLPSGLQSKLSSMSNKQQGGSLLGVSIMGVLSALIVGPCMAPPLMGILLFIGQTGDPILGGMALFVMSLGMGIPLIILGTSAGKFMPRAGVWMDTVKAVFGVMMLGVAIWMLERVLPASIIMWLWALLLFIAGIYMGALTPIHDNTSGWDRLWKGLGLIMMLYAAVLIVGVSSGNSDYFSPLKGLSSAPGSASEQHVAFKRIKSLADLKQQLEAAKQQNKPLMLDFYADWCTYCKSMEKTTFQSQNVITALEDFIVLQADVTENDEIDEQLMKHLQIPAPPAILFFDPAAGEKRGFRVVGYKNGDDFAEHVNQFLNP